VAAVIRLRPEQRAEYIEIHRDVWPGVLAALRTANVKNYSIYLHGDLLFSYLEYWGTDYRGDMARVADDETTKRWWALTGPMQESVRQTEDDPWWTPVEEVFHLD
jgi:L-rhamnose mutarotase